MGKPILSAEVRQQVQEVVQPFNQVVLGKRAVRYVVRFKGSFLYLDGESTRASRPRVRTTACHGSRAA